jgi:hypothetical protein
MTALSRRALTAALALAAEHGIRCADPEILRDHSNLIVRLHPAPVVARVATLSCAIRQGGAGSPAREVAVARHLAAAGAPVVAPSSELDPGPHVRDGLTLSFWTYVPELTTPLDGADAGRRLRHCHECLAGYDGDLPSMAMLSEPRAAVERLADDGTLREDDATILREVGARMRRRFDELGLPVQAIHGDAHLGNVINSSDGPLWNDWEDAGLGPREWDLCCLRAISTADDRDPADRAQSAYGPPLDERTLALLDDARRFQVTVWSVVMAAARPERRDQSARLLDWYRDCG